MTIQQLADKEFVGALNRPCCEIVGYREESLHDIILTKDGDIYLICENCRRQYLNLMQARNIEKYKKLREQGHSAYELSHNSELFEK